MAQITSGSLTIVDVTDGAPGLNNTTVFLYRRAVSAPDKPTGNLTYTFSTASITGTLEGWVQSINELTGSNPIWMIAAVASSNGETDVIESSEWAGPIKMAQNGQDGLPGTNGLNQATIFIYKRADSAMAPSSTTYTFATGGFTVPSGWSKTIPTEPKGKPCWVTSAIAIGAEATVELNWVAPSVLVEDGTSPTVTATENGVKIVDGDGHETYITHGKDGTSYYTFVRYSKNANGSGYVVTPTSETIYIGVYTGAESSPPAYNDSGWTWSRYVGADGQPGTPGGQGPQGISVTSTRELYYLKTNSTDPAQITNANQIHTTDDVNQWTSVVPTYIGSGKYYTCIETTLSNGNVVWSTPIENKGLTDANVNAANAIEIARGVKQHFFWVATDKSTNVPAGAYVAEQSEESFYSNPTKGNVLTRSDGIWIRNGVDKLATLQGSGLTFLVPTGTYKGQKSVSLNGSGLTFYNIGSSNSAAATLASDGLQITNGSIVLGTTSGTSAGNVTLSNKNFNRSINETPHNDLRFAIGSKFGVASDGTLYASNADIKGKITATSGSIGGWTIAGQKIYAGDGSTIKTAVMQAPSSSVTWVFAAGGSSHDSYNDCPFRVDKTGALYATSGVIGGWNINASHIYKYTAAATTVYDNNKTEEQNLTSGAIQYGAFMQAVNGTPTPDQGAFYVGYRKCTTISNNTPTYSSWIYPFVVHYDGTIIANRGQIAGWTITGSCIEKDNTGDTNGTRCGIQNSNTYDSTRAVFYAGTKTAAGGYIANETDSNFYVRQDGYMYCKNAKVAGTITASSGSIGGWNIGTDGHKSLYAYTNSTTTQSPVPGTSGLLLLSPQSSNTNTAAIAGSGTGLKWFISAGNVFGVTDGGALYASGATINGNTTIAGNTTITGNATIDSSVTIGGKNQSEYLNDNINVGGRNLLRGTASVVIGSGQTEGSWANAKFYKSDSTDGTVESVSYSNPLNLATVIKATAGSTTNANIGFAQAAVPIAKTTVTLSAWVKGTAGDTVRLQPCYLESTEPKPESGYKDFTITDSNWHRYEYTKTLAYDHLDGSVRAGFVYGRTATAGRVFYICGVKLEYGNKATDWNQAPEDESGVNLVPWPYYRYAISGSPYTSQGITWTLNADGSVTAKGTASAENNSWYHCVDNRDAKNPNGMYCLPAGTYTLSGCPAGGSSTTYRNQINFYSDTLNPSTEATDTDGNSYRYDLGKGVTFTLASKTYIRIHPVIYKGVTCPNAGYTFYPMLESGGVVHKFVSPKLNEGAASTASKYITRITDEGIYISPADQLPTANAPGNSIKIDGSGMEVFRDNSSVAFYGEFTRIGEGDKYQALISESGIEFSDSDGANKFSVVPSGQYYSQQKTTSFTILPSGTISFRANIEAHAITFSLYNPTSTGEGNIQSVTVDSSQMAIGSTVTVGNATYQCKIRRRDINTFFAQQTGSTRTILRLDLSWTSGYNIEMTKISFTGINPILVNDVVQLMQASQTVYLSEPISNQLTGIVLAWSAFENGEAKDEDWNYTFIPKNHVRLFNSKRVSTGLLTSENSAEFIGIKYVEIYDNCIKGYAGNESSSTSQGITYTNNHWVLRYVYGV